MYKELLNIAHAAVQSIGIALVPRDLDHWIKAQDVLIARAHYYVRNDMQRKCAVDYSTRVIGNIAQEKYGAAYPPSPPYHPRYAVWKAARYPMKTWQLKGDLLRNVTYFRAGEGWAGGVMSGVMDSGGKSWLGWGRGPRKEIAMYARIGELGPKARPVFAPTADEYADDPEGWVKRGAEALQKVKVAWT